MIEAGSSRLANKVIVVTGASGGIASATVRMLAKGGARLALLDRDPALLEALRSELSESSRHRGWALDLTDDARLDVVFGELIAHFGRVDALINNAGLLIGGHFEEAPAARLRKLIDVNLYVPLRMCQLAVPVMRHQGSGHIVNVFSSAGLLAVPGFAAYGATKSGLFAFSRTLRRELRGSGIKVSAFCPGATRSPMTEAMTEAGGNPGGETPHPVAKPAGAFCHLVEHRGRSLRSPPVRLAQGIAMFLDRVFPKLLDGVWAKRCNDAYYGMAARGGRPQ